MPCARALQQALTHCDGAVKRHLSWPATCTVGCQRFEGPHALPGLSDPDRRPVPAAPSGPATGQQRLAAADRALAAAPAVSGLRDAVEPAPDPQPSGLRHRQRDDRGPARRHRGTSAARAAVRQPAALSQDGRSRAGATAPGTAGRAAVGPFRHAAARNPAHPAAGPRCLHHRLAQRARCRTAAWQLRPAGLHQLPDALHRDHRPRLPCGGGLPALRRRPGRDRLDGGGRASGPAAQPDPDGRAGGLPDQPDRGQPAGRSNGSSNT